MAKSNNWSKEETIIAFNVYCKIPFKILLNYYFLLKKDITRKFVHKNKFHIFGQKLSE